MSLNLLTICSETGGASESTLPWASGEGLSHLCPASYGRGNLGKVAYFCFCFCFFSEFQFPHPLGGDNDTPLSPRSAHISSLGALLALTSASHLQNPTSDLSVFL